MKCFQVILRNAFTMPRNCRSHAFFNNVFVCLVVIYMECMFALNDLFQVSNTMNTSKANLSGSSVEPNDTIYLCNFRVSVDGEWLCLKVRRFLDPIGSLVFTLLVQT